MAQWCMNYRCKSPVQRSADRVPLMGSQILPDGRGCPAKFEIPILRKESMRVARATGARRFQWSVPYKALASGQGFCNDSSYTTIPFGISVMRMTDIPNGIVVYELSLQKPCPEASALYGTDHWNLLAPVALATRMLSFLRIGISNFAGQPRPSGRICEPINGTRSADLWTGLLQR